MSNLYSNIPPDQHRTIVILVTILILGLLSGL